MISTTEKFPNDKIICVTHGFTVKAAALDVLQPKDVMSLPEPRNTSITKIIALPKSNEFYLDYYNQLPY